MNEIRERNLEISKFIKENPDLTKGEIAKHFNVNKEIVRGIIRTLEGKRKKDYKSTKSEEETQEFVEKNVKYELDFRSDSELNKLIEESNIDLEKFDIKKAFVRKRDNGTKDLYTSYVEIQAKDKNFDFKDTFLEDLIKAIKTNVKPQEPPIYIQKQGDSLVVYISDVHVGALVDNDCLYPNPYNEFVLFERAGKLIREIHRLNDMFKFSNITIMNLGDSMDGNYGKTSRGGHTLPQNMNGKQQFMKFFEMIKYIFDNIETIQCEKSYISVGTSNHSGFEEYMVNKAIEIYLNTKYPFIYTKVAEKSIDTFEINETTIIFLHGKDEMSQRFSFPLTLDQKTELFFTDYITKNNIYKFGKKISVRKGDLHQTAYTEGKLFDYGSLRSFFGGNHYSSVNYGSTKAGVDLEIISNTGSSMKSSLPFN